MKYNKFLEDLEIIDNDHKKFSIETPLRKDAFEISDEDKVRIIQNNVREDGRTFREHYPVHPNKDEHDMWAKQIQKEIEVL